MSLASARKAPTPRSGLFLCPLPSAVSGAGPCRTGWTARGNRRLRGFGQIRGRLPPTGLPGGEITKGTKGSTRGHEARRGGKGQSQRTQRERSMAGESHLGSAGSEGGRERSAGEARRATGGARKPPAHPCVFAVKSPKPPSLQTSKPPPLPASLPRTLASLRSNPPSLQASKLPSLLLCPQASRATLRLCGQIPQASKPPNFQASSSARKPPAHPCVFAVTPQPASLSRPLSICPKHPRALSLTGF